MFGHDFVKLKVSFSLHQLPDQTRPPRAHARLMETFLTGNLCFDIPFPALGSKLVISEYLPALIRFPKYDDTYHSVHFQALSRYLFLVGAFSFKEKSPTITVACF